LRVDDAIRQFQIDKLNKIKAQRDNEKVKSCLTRLEENAKADTNVMPAIIDACENYVSLGEISDTLRKIFGIYKG